MKKTILAIIKPTISLGLIIFIIQKVDIRHSLSLFREINLIYYTLALLLIFTAWFINSRKWQTILIDLKIKNHLPTLFKLNLISIFYATVLPGGQITGEVIKYCKIEDRKNNRKEIISSIFFDRLTGLIALIILGFFAFILSDSEKTNYSSILSIFLILITGALAVIFSFSKLFLKLLNKFKSFIPSNSDITIVRKAYSALLLFSQKYKLIITSLAYGIIFQSFIALAQLSIAQSLNIDISFYDIAWLNALVSLAILLPISIAGIGVRELSYIQLFAIINIDNTQAVAFSFLITITTFLIGIIGGLLETKSLVSKIKKSKNCSISSYGL